jgi:uncharacterized membrane protein
MVFENGGLLALVPLLSANQQPHVRATAALAISNLARLYPPSRAAILHSEDGKGVGFILGILTTPLALTVSDTATSSIRSFMLELVESLSVEQGFVKLINSLDVLPNLISQLDEKVAVERKQHVHLIRLLNIFINIANDRQARDLLLGTELLGRLVKIMTIDQSILVPFEALSISSENDLALKEAREKHQAEAKAAELLSILVTSDDVKARVNAQDHLKGLIPALVQLVVRAGAGSASCTPSLLPDVKYVAAIAAKNLAMLALNESNREVIRETGGVEAVAYILRTPTSASPDASVGADVDTLLIVYVVWALQFLAFNEKNREILLKNGGIPALISLLTYPSEQVLILTIRVLRNLLCNAHVSSIFITSEFGIKYLYDILSSSHNDYLLSQVVELMQNLMLYDNTRKILCDYATSTATDKVKGILQAKLEYILFSAEGMLR